MSKYDTIRKRTNNEQPDKLDSGKYSSIRNRSEPINDVPKEIGSTRQDFAKQTGVATIPTVQNIPMFQKMQQNPLPTTSYNPEQELKGRDLPVVGPILRTLDAIEANPIRKKAGEIVQELYTPGAGLNAINTLTRGADSLVGRGLAKVAPKLSGLGEKVVRTAATEALVGAPLTSAQYLSSGGTDLKEAAKQGLYGGLIGGTTGGVAPLAGTAFKKFAGTSIGESLSNLIKRKQSITPESENAVMDALKPQKTTTVNGRLRPASQEAYINKVMGEFQPIVMERMTPPLENPNELAKWLQPHLGEESLNEVRKLPYEDMRQLAEEVKGHLSTYDVARQVAKERGYNLDNILEGKLPSITERVKQDASKRAYGIYDAPNIDPVRPVSPEYKPSLEPSIGSELPKSKASGNLLGDIKDSLTAKPTSGIAGRNLNEYERSSLNDTKSQLTSKSIKEPISAKEAAQSGYRKIVDDLYRFKDFDEFAEKTLKKKLRPSEQSHTLALNSRGTDMVAKQILTENMVDINGNVVGRSLKNATQQIPKSELIDFEDYQVAKHALTRMERGEKVYRDNLEQTIETVKKKVEEYERKNPNYAKLNDEFITYSNNLGENWLVDTGITSPESWQGYRESNPFYTPNFRKFSDTEKVSGKGSGKGFVAGNPIKKAVGSQRKIISPTESRIEQTDQYVKVGTRNRVMQSIVKTVQKDPEAFEAFVEILPMTDNMSQRALKELNEIQSSDGIDGVVNFMNDNFDRLFNTAKEAGRKDLDNVVPVMFDGKPTYIRVHDAPLLEAMTALTPKAQGIILDTARKVTGTMKLLTTGVNPVFSLTRNLVRDIPMSFVASKSTNNPVKFTWDLVDSVVSIMGNKDLYTSFKAVGGGHSSPIAADRNLLSQAKADVLPQRNRLKNLGTKIKGGVENFTNALETAPRLGEYKRITKAGGNSADSKIQGLFEANDVTVNFKRRGNWSHEVDAFVPYFNAAIQGLDKTFRTYKDNPAAAALKSVAAITIPSVFLFAVNYKNKNYQQLDERTKDTYYLIPKQDGTFYKLPKPREGGVPFGSGVERVLRSWLQKDPEAFKGFAENVRQAFAPPVISGFTEPGTATDKLVSGSLGSTILGPLSDLRANKDFAGRTIVPGYLQGASPKLQYDSQTSGVAKWIGDKLNTSPKEIDYLAKSYTGIVGQLGIPLSSPGGAIGETLKRQVTADPVYSNGISNELYGNKDKLDTAKKDYSITGELPKWYNDELRTFLNRVTDTQSDIRKQMRAIENDKTIDAANKRNQLRTLQEQINELGKQANEAAKPIMK